MAIPSVRATATPTVDAVGGVTSKTVAVPAGGQAGDIYQIVATYQWFAAGTPAAATASGFGQVVTASLNTGSRANRLTVLAREYDGTEGATFTVTVDSAVTYIVITCQIVQDADTSGTISAALDGTAVTNTAGGGVSSIALASVTTTQPNSGAFAAAACYSNVIASDPSTWTQVDQGDSGFIEIYRKAMAAAGATGTDTVGLTSEQSAVVATWAWKAAATGITVALGQAVETDTIPTAAVYEVQQEDAFELEQEDASRLMLEQLLSVVPILSAGGITVALGQATETDSALAATKAKTLTPGQATETDSGLALTRSKTVMLGQATETDTGLAAPATKTVVLGQATETDSALTLVGGTTVALGQATETDSALALVRTKTVVLGQATETDSGLAPTATKTLTPGQATEADSGLTLTAAKIVGLGQAAEADSALPLVAGTVVALGQATETDSAFTLARAKTVALGIATETDAALGLSSSTTVALGIATETDTTFTVARTKTRVLGQAAETDEALPLDPGVDTGQILAEIFQEPTTSTTYREATTAPAYFEAAAASGFREQVHAESYREPSMASTHRTEGG